MGIGYLFERGHKRQHRLQAARDQTAVTRAQTTDAERTLAFNVGQQFVSVLLAESTLRFAEQYLKSFQQTVDIGETQYKAGAISEADFLKIKLQLLQFQTDVSSARAGAGAGAGRAAGVAGIRRRAGEFRRGRRSGLPAAECRTRRFAGQGAQRQARSAGRQVGRDRRAKPDSARQGQRQSGRGHATTISPMWPARIRHRFFSISICRSSTAIRAKSRARNTP